MSYNRWLPLVLGSLLALMVWLAPAVSLGAGTSAGTTIFNHATVDYVIGASSFMETSNTYIHYRE